MAKTRKKKDDLSRAKLGDLRKKLDQAEAGWKRALADYQNLEKRLSKEREEIIRLANTVLIAKFLGVLDDLERAWDHRQDEGLTLILKHFRSILDSEGIEEIKAEKELFDPYRMECVGTAAESEVKEEQVVRVTKKGYLLKNDQGKDQVIRPAEVIVNRKNQVKSQ